MTQVKYITIDDSKKLLKNESLNLFQELFWWQILEIGFKKKCKVALIIDENENKALLPLFFHKIGPILRVGSPLRGTFTPYMGFIWLTKNINDKQKIKYLKLIIDSLVKYGANRIELSFGSNKKSFNENLLSLGFNFKNAKTILLNTEQEEEILWMGMQGRSRNLVRKAQKFGLQVKFLGSDLKNLDLFYSLLEETFKKSGKRPPHAKTFYKLLIQKLIISNNLLFLSIIKESNVVAMGVFLYNSEEIHFISGTSNVIGNKFGANNLMHWEVIKFASNSNIKKYDFGGLGISSIDKFKKSFGGVEGSYSNYIWMSPKIKFIFSLFTWLTSKFPFFNFFKI
jgi:predicted N-acyltransferase